MSNHNTLRNTGVAAVTAAALFSGAACSSTSSASKFDIPPTASASPRTEAPPQPLPQELRPLASLILGKFTKYASTRHAGVIISEADNATTFHDVTATIPLGRGIREQIEYTSDSPKPAPETMTSIRVSVINNQGKTQEGYTFSAGNSGLPWKYTGELLVSDQVINPEDKVDTVTTHYLRTSSLGGVTIESAKGTSVGSADPPHINSIGVAYPTESAAAVSSIKRALINQAEAIAATSQGGIPPVFSGVPGVPNSSYPPFVPAAG